MTYRSESVLILDFGGQSSQQLARQIRSLGVYSEIFQYNISISELHGRAPERNYFVGRVVTWMERRK